MSKRKIKINFIPVDGDVLDAIVSAVYFNVKSVLNKHGAVLTRDIREIIREHSKI